MDEETDVRELRLGVYATPGAVRELLRQAHELLARHSSTAWQLTSRAETAPTDEGDEGDERSLAELYPELVEQWRTAHPGADPGPRRVTELRVGVRASAAEARELSEALVRLACPDVEHTGPCALPWSASVLDAEDEETRRRLLARYGPLA